MRSEKKMSVVCRMKTVLLLYNVFINILPTFLWIALYLGQGKIKQDFARSQPVSTNSVSLELQDIILVVIVRLKVNAAVNVITHV